ncbi:FG-GAP-like repeat-containing protein [Streptomyces sp. TG1A-60]|uniref:FG-GAP-like repeat-containing protein n=1 Tax=Streptomyces sp. TG1A-60 TaxID=3129111 RepID=UPI0030D57566
MERRGFGLSGRDASDAQNTSDTPEVAEVPDAAKGADATGSADSSVSSNASAKPRTSRRAKAGVVGLVAAALGIGLLAVPPLLDGSDGSSDSPAKTKSDASGPLDEDAAQARAVSAGKRVEVTGLRTETSTTYAKPDGSFELVAYGAPVRARVKGAWKPIDTTLTEVDGGWAPKAAADPVVFSGGRGRTSSASSARRAVHQTVRQAVYTVADSGTAVRTTDDTDTYTPLATLTSDDHEVTLSWPGELPEPVISGASALYRNVFTDVDLLLTAQDSGFSHVLVVHTPEAAADPALAKVSYGLSSPDLTFRLDPVTKVVTGENRAGEEIAVSPTPYMWDSAGGPAVTEGDDPEPAEPGEDPSPSYSEDPDEEVGEEPDVPSDGDDTAAPETTPGDGTSADAAAYRDEDLGHGAAARAGHAGHVRTGTTTDVTRTGTTTNVVRTALTDSEVLALPGLAGPGVGSHLAVADAELSAPGTGSTALGITPDTDFTTDEDTVYPVFVDPTIYGKTKNWTTAYKKYPSSSFYDGANYNSGTTEARVGLETTTWGLSRSFFRLNWGKSIKGAVVSSASIKLRETYSWSCSNREMQVWHTGGISSKTTWRNQPSWKKRIGTKSFAHGYNSSCPDAYVKYNAKSIAQDAANGGWKEFTIGLRATTETSAYAWKKFRAEGSSAPKLTITYNRKPKVPSSLDQAPGPRCDRTKPYAHIGKRDLTLSARSSDPDGNLKYLHFQLWRTGYGDSKILDKRVVTAARAASATVSKNKLTNGHTYSWRVRAIDSSGAASRYAPTADPKVCRFVFDSDVPNEPLVTSTDFPEADEDGSVWSKADFGTAGRFTFAPDEDKDITKFQYSFNTTSYSTTVPVGAGASATVTRKPPFAGPNVLYVRAVDSAGNPSLGTKYLFYVTPRDSADRPGDVTGDAIPDLFAVTSGGNLRMYPSSTAGDLHGSLEAAHEDGVPLLADPDEDGEDHLPGYWMGADGNPALIAHGGDGYPGDGISDLFARMPDGGLYVYPGDGYGSVDIARRMTVRLPSNAPDPAVFDQFIVGDHDSDGRTDLFATTEGGGMWAFEGYTGATFTTATKIAASAWAPRDLVSIGDHDGDGAPDLVWRSEVSDRLYVRYGVKDTEGTAGGSTIASLATAAASRTGKDEIYAEGWAEGSMPVTHLYGTPDVTGDGIPDLWSLASDGSVRFYKGGRTSLGSGTAVISSGSKWATTKLTFG